jgi:hypothetical protein
MQTKNAMYYAAVRVRNLLAIALPAGKRITLSLTAILTIFCLQAINSRAEGSIISMRLNLDNTPSSNAFLVTLNHWVGGVDQETAIARGYVDVDMDLAFNPMTLEATPLSVKATGGSWSINDMSFEYHYTLNNTSSFISAPPVQHTLIIPVTGVQGAAWSVAPHTVTGGVFPAAGFSVGINDGDYKEYLDGSLVSSVDFSVTPMSAGLGSGNGHIAVNFVSLVGNTATYQVTSSLNANTTIPIGLSTLNIAGEGNASGRFSIQVPEPSALLLLSMGIISLAFCGWRRR